MPDRIPEDVYKETPPASPVPGFGCGPEGPGAGPGFGPGPDFGPGGPGQDFGPGGPGGPHGPHGEPNEKDFVQPHMAVVRSEDGTIHFHMRAGEGADVTVTIGNEQEDAITLPLTDSGRGNFRADCTDCPLEGPQKLVFRVNGQETLNTGAPLWYQMNSLTNYIELPDPETDALIAARKDIPHGSVRHEFYYSEVYGEFRSSLIYTPPGYEEGGEYPVLYLFHEVAENMTAWTDAARMNFVLDNLIAEGQCLPFLVVENDCTVMLNYHALDDWFTNYPELEQFLLKDCIPYMESHYRVISDKWSRAIGGYGLGAAQAGYIGMRNTDVFGSIGLFTAFWISAGFHAQGKEDPVYDAAQYIAAHPEVIDVFFRSEGDRDRHYDSAKAENDLLAEIGVDRLPGYVWKVYHQSHHWGSYRRSLRDFAPLLFRK